ncbi:outer membrane beta-barrel protein [Capnocytophaga granulosa]|uniref:outer membrane beta-barrel protein n=1 Tax=Capnocytophaga granulosa TaxID=45242 RepID=UPI0028E33052|nr:outer membrane beta-barrel protein [Capnocytophaga granulosa]
MKKFLFLAGLFMAAATASAQADLGKGNLQLNAGTGISGWGIPVYVGLDYGVTDEITVGGELSYRYDTSSYAIRANFGRFGEYRSDKITYRHHTFGVFTNGNYHFNRLLRLPRQLDLYAGASLGFFFGSVTSSEGNIKYTGDDYSGFSAALQTGARYFFTDNFGVNLELSGGVLTSGLKAGITYKF